jgi:hypothetical protein
MEWSRAASAHSWMTRGLTPAAAAASSGVSIPEGPPQTGHHSVGGGADIPAPLLTTQISRVNVVVTTLFLSRLFKRVTPFRFGLDFGGGRD